MSWLEIGLVLYMLVMLASYIAGSDAVGKKIVLWHSVGVILFGLHLAFEGFRIQRLLLYLIVILYWSVLLWKAYRQKGLKRIQQTHIRKRVALSGMWGMLIVIALTLPAYILPKIIPPLPTGPFTVGTVKYHWIDEMRLESFTPQKDDYRGVIVRIWYPGEMTAEASPASYAYESDQMDRLGKGQPFYIKAILNSIKYAETHSYMQLRVSQAHSHYPVLVLSPGLGAAHFMYTGITEELASQGYIVAAIEHTYYSDIPALFPDGRITEGKYEFTAEADDWDMMNEHIERWTEDVKFVLDCLEKVNIEDPQNILTGALDISRIGMLGHSFGGATTAQVMQQDPRVLAGVNMDGFPYGKKPLEGLAHPFLYMMTEDIGKFSELKLTEEEWREFTGSDSREAYVKLAEQFNERKHSLLKNNGVEAVIQGADHMSFSDVGLYSPLISNTNPGLHKEIIGMLLNFFDKYVRTEV